MKKMKLELIDISRYTEKFKEYPSDLIEFTQSHGIELPNISSMRGQALALMAQKDVRGYLYLRREETSKFFENIGMKTHDAIQQFNKATGVKRIKGRGIYCLYYPFEADTLDTDKRKGVKISGDKDIAINSVKNFWMENLINVPNSEWQIGHLDPTIADASETNLAYQPPIQARYRNRFKWDDKFHKMWPTTTELLPNLEQYYTQEEQLAMYNHLKQKFDP